MRAERIKYPMGAVTAEGALIYDENVSGKRPAVLVAPNWLGMTDKAVQRGEFVAGNRYVVFVADMYGAGTRPADFGEAAALANPLRADAVEQRRRVKAAFATMIAQAKMRNLIDDRRTAVTRINVARCSLRDAVTRSAVAFLGVSRCHATSEISLGVSDRG